MTFAELDTSMKSLKTGDLAVLRWYGRGRLTGAAGRLLKAGMLTSASGERITNR